MPMKTAEAWRILGLKEGTPLERIRPRFKKMIMKWFPANQSERLETSRRFSDLVEAYKVLSVGEEDPPDWAENLADIYEMFKFGPRGPKGHNPKTCRCSHCVTGWDNFSSDEEEVNEDYKRVWYSNESDDSDEYDDGYGVGRYAGGKKKNPHVVGKILGTMSQRMYEFNGGLRKKEKAKAEALKKQAEEAEKIAAALIKEEEEEKEKNEKKKQKNKKKRAAKAKKKAKKTNTQYEANSEEETPIQQIAEEDKKPEVDSHWDTNSAFFQAAVKSEENSTKNETVKLPIPMEPTVELLSNTVAVEGHEEEYSETEIKESRRMAALANRFAVKKDFKNAIEKFTEAISIYPLDQRYYGNRSYCYEHLEEYEKALDDAEAALSLSTDWPKGYFRKGKALLGLQKFPEAEAAFLQVLDLDKSYDDAKTELMNTRYRCFESLGFSKEKCDKAFTKYDTIQQALDELLAPPVSKKQSNEFIKVPIQTRSFNKEIKPSNGHSNFEDLSKSVWVGNVNQMVKEAELKKIFSTCGPVESLRILRGRHCAFVNYYNSQHASKSIDELQGYYIGGQYLLVRFPDNTREGMPDVTNMT